LFDFADNIPYLLAHIFPTLDEVYWKISNRRDELEKVVAKQCELATQLCASTCATATAVEKRCSSVCNNTVHSLAHSLAASRWQEDACLAIACGLTKQALHMQLLLSTQSSPAR
jgi:hypothetical protein